MSCPASSQIIFSLKRKKKEKKVNHKRGKSKWHFTKFLVYTSIRKWEGSRWKYFFTTGWMWRSIFLFQQDCLLSILLACGRGFPPRCLPSLDRSEQWLSGLGFLFSHLIGFPRTEVSSQFYLTSPLLPVGHPEKEGSCSYPPLWPDVILPLSSARHLEALTEASTSATGWRLLVLGAVFSVTGGSLTSSYVKTVRKPPAELPGSTVSHLRSSEATTPLPQL